MTWQLTEQGALFAIFILVFALSGYRRGWKRETISLLFIVLGLVFLLLYGGAFLAKLLYQFLLNVNLSEQQLITSHMRLVLITSIVAVAVIVAIGYAAGRRFPKSTDLGGIILGIITGALVAAYVTYILFPDTESTLVSSGTVYTGIVPNLTANLTVVIIFLAALVAIVIGLVRVRPKKSGGGGGGGGHK